MHSKYTTLANVAHYIFSILPHRVGVGASVSLGWDVIDWRQSKTRGETLWGKGFVRHFARANNKILVGDNAVLNTMNTENDLEIKRQLEAWKLPRMAKVHDRLELWQGSQNQHAIQKESRAQNKSITAVGYISDTEEIVKASWSNFQHDGVAAFILSERSSLPPALSAKHLPVEWTQVLNGRRIKRIDRHPAEIVEDRTPQSISDSETCLDWNVDWANPNASEDNSEADNLSHIELDSGIEDLERLEQGDLIATPNVPRLIWPTWISKKIAEKLLMTMNTIEMRRNKRYKKK